MLGRRFSTAALMGAALLFAASVDAAPKRKAKKACSKDAAKRLKDERFKTRTLFALDWHDDWKAAVTRNKIDVKNAKPILFLRILGDLAAET